VKPELIVEKALLVTFLALGIVTMVLADALPYSLFRNLGSSPGAFPWVLGLLIATLSLLRLLTSFVKYRKSGGTEPGIEPFASRLPFALIAVSLAFSILLPYLGFVLSALLWMGSILLLFRPVRPLFFSLIVVSLIALTYLAFLFYLPVPLPAGRLFQWLF
jgi:hypothetical protein